MRSENSRSSIGGGKTLAEKVRCFFGKASIFYKLVIVRGYNDKSSVYHGSANYTLSLITDVINAMKDVLGHREFEGLDVKTKTKIINEFEKKVTYLYKELAGVISMYGISDNYKNVMTNIGDLSNQLKKMLHQQQKGGRRSSSKTKTTEKFIYNGRSYIVYVGSKGGKYIKYKGQFKACKLCST